MIDKKDQKIIKELKKNSRSSVREIAKSTAIRPSTVHKRIQDLVRDKVIEKFTVKLSNNAVDEGLIAFLFLTTESDLDKNFFHNEYIKEVFGITGEYDLVLKLKFKDIQEFNSFLIGLRKNKNIRKTLTMISTITIKEEI